MSDLTTRVVPSLASVAVARWNALDHGSSPFTEHGFLVALERSGSVGTAAGWEPHYVLVERGGGARAEKIGDAELRGRAGF